MNWRPNGLFFQMAQMVAARKPDTKLIIGNEGGSRCFAPGTMVITDHGIKLIQHITMADRVVSFNESSRKQEYKSVLDVIENKDHGKKCILVKLKNGSVIRCTEDHKFYFEGAWHSIKHILSLWDERRNLEADTKV